MEQKIDEDKRMLPICIETNSVGRKTVTIGGGNRHRERLPPISMDYSLCDMLGIQCCDLPEVVSAANTNVWRVFLDLDSPDRYIKTQTVIDNSTLDAIFGGDWYGRGTYSFDSTLLKRVEAWDRLSAPSAPAVQEECTLKAAGSHGSSARDGLNVTGDVPARFVGIDVGVLARFGLESVSLDQAIAKVGVKGQSVFLDMNSPNRYLVGARADVGVLNVKLGGNWLNCRESQALVELLRRVAKCLAIESAEAAAGANKGVVEDLLQCLEGKLPEGVEPGFRRPQDAPFSRSMQFNLHAKMPLPGETGEAAFLGLFNELVAAFRGEEWQVNRKGWERIGAYIHAVVTAPRIS